MVFLGSISTIKTIYVISLDIEVIMWFRVEVGKLLIGSSKFRTKIKNFSSLIRI